MIVRLALEVVFASFLSPLLSLKHLFNLRVKSAPFQKRSKTSFIERERKKDPHNEPYDRFVSVKKYLNDLIIKRYH